MRTPSHVVVENFLLNVKIRYLLLAFWTFFNNSSVKTSFPCNSSHCSMCCFHFFLKPEVIPVDYRPCSRGRCKPETKIIYCLYGDFLHGFRITTVFAVSNTHTRAFKEKKNGSSDWAESLQPNSSGRAWSSPRNNVKQRITSQSKSRFSI